MENNIIKLINEAIESVLSFAASYFDEFVTELKAGKDEEERRFKLYWKCYQEDRIEELKEAIKKEYPGIYKKYYKLNKTYEIKDFFINREEELKQVLNIKKSVNYLCIAPSGYGKTFFFEKLEKEIKQLNKLPNNNTAIHYFDFLEIASIKKKIEKTKYKSLDIISNLISKKIKLENNDLELYKKISHALNKGQHTKIFLIFDHYEELLKREEIQKEFEPLLLKLISKIKEDTNSILSIILAGREVEMTGQEFHYNQEDLRLSEFSEETISVAIEKSFKRTVTTTKFEKTHKLHKIIWELTGGHPKCIKNIITNELEKKEYCTSVIDIFESGTNKTDIIKDYTKTEIDKVTESTFIKHENLNYYGKINFNKQDIENILNVISVFRIFNQNTVRYILTNIKLLEKFKDKSSDIFKLLKNTNLFRKHSAFYKDSISRHLFFNYIKNINKPTFKIINNCAINMYDTWITDRFEEITSENKEAYTRYVKEYIYHCLIDEKIFKNNRKKEITEKLDNYKRVCNDDETDNCLNDLYHYEIKSKDPELHSLLLKIYSEKPVLTLFNY